MNQADAKAILKYIKVNFSDNEKLCKGLREVKEKIDTDQRNCYLFRMFGLTSILLNCLSNLDEYVIKWTLSVWASCLMEKEFLIESHVAGTPLLFKIFKDTKCAVIQQRICIIIGLQCSSELSCSTLHNLNASKIIIAFLKETESEGEKELAIRTLRYLCKNTYHQKLILREKGIFHVCQHILNPCEQLRQESLKTLLHFNKWPTTLYFRQLLEGTDNLQDLRKVYELHEEMKNEVFKFLLMVFSYHSSYSNTIEYSTNCQVLDYLCMAKLPVMIVSELQPDQERKQDKIDESQLIVHLCKFCELDSQWKKFSFNVLPTYHERMWMQLTDCQGIPLLISLLSSKRRNLTLLQALFRGLLGIESLISLKVKVLMGCMEAKLLPLLSEIFDDGLKETCGVLKEDTNLSKCHHLSSEKEAKKKRSISKEIPKEVLELLNFPEVSSSKLDVEEVWGSSQRIPKSNHASSSKMDAQYKQLNHFKFRTGKRTFQFNNEKRKMNWNFPNRFKIEENGLLNASKEAMEESPAKESGGDTYAKSLPTLSEKTQIWMNILEYIVRLFYQVLTVREDMSSICKLFLLKFYHYISRSWDVHPTALKLLLAITKNSSSIQHVLDILFIPKLAVDLVHENSPKKCTQCALINNGVDSFLQKLQVFFNHHHQYGQCEVANRLNPSKPEQSKRSCLVALPHVVKCPKLLNNFLLDHRGLDSLLSIFTSTDADSRMHLYGIASISTVTFRLMVEYSRKYSTCLFCDTNHKAKTRHYDLDVKKKKKQLLTLTNPSNAFFHCNWKEDETKNCSFQFPDKHIYANREKLSNSNEVLKAMFQGSFSESLEKCIEINDLNGTCMEMVIHFIYGCTCEVFRCQDVTVYDELIFVAQMYFIPELQILAVHYLSLLLDPEDIYTFIKNRVEILGEDLIRHLFCSLISKPMPFESKGKWVDQFLASPLKDAFINHIFKGLSLLLSDTSSICNCDSFRTYM